MWSTFYVDANGSTTGARPFPIPPASQPFVAESKAFYNVIGTNPSLSVIAQASDNQFHEAGVYISATNEVYFTSNILNKTGANENYQYPIYANFNKVSLNSTNGTYEWQVVPQPSSQFVLPNGGTYYNGKVLMAIQGYQLNTPSSLIAFDPFTQRAETLLNNFYGRPFNSLNDVAVLTRGRNIKTPVGEQWVFFTDPTYGYYLQKFKQYPRLPSQVYAFHPPTGTIRVVADGLQKPNGIQFSPDMQTCYISDTGLLSEDPADSAPRDGSGPGTIYPEPGSDPTTDPPALINKRLFAFADNVAPDGIKVDTDGNVYGGCFDGVHVWLSLLGLEQEGCTTRKDLLGLDVPSEIPGVPAGRGCANMVFVPGGLLMFAEDRMYLARIKAKGALLP
ncbi:SMP-30/gluconolaconase/LRE-like region protein [Rhizoctonia solani]|uniref:SMP-30/gluconolaconase/LRE-like region protein n=1 Tax=Rhizoctonia solani TaxID=456999 RepID=A0A8H8SWX9_9AGAM|nr:SMP-30/gluconolaconase/LRE-like region protein [Rhizoctonia solani]QRW19977.1 SMP-30/gluconolaconase/LRE-like region protein [Rhizoctonia solani]